ncbi:hypothetical protein EYB53_024085 [Candidatus Chloroploca sp. M-50]|uniref:Baseplate protein J-like domain-containing protein n=1 Tax=Candidatus Chloroploca mongolica TaxID=2528176 RepID=A0ABS4DHA6_9CHLR|nr:hypothetical protein [Candidatus Chloroploca mongolica]MBP1468812.1 hypothetical protein [Candidatus Chloroploca mongolica]
MLLDMRETPLILVLPDEPVALLYARIRQTGAPRVQLLVPEGGTALHADTELAQLARLAADDGLSLMVISSDTALLAAARAAGFETIAVQGASVVAPPSSGADQASRLLAPSPEQGAGLASPPPESAAPHRITDEAPSNQVRDEDADFLAALDDLDLLPPAPGGTLGTVDEADEVAAATASLKAALTGIPLPQSVVNELPPVEPVRDLPPPRVEPTLPPPRSTPPPPPPPTRLGPPTRSRATYAAPAETAPRPASEAVPPAPITAPPSRRARSWPMIALTTLLLALLLLIAGVLLLGSRVTVAVSPPRVAETTETIVGLPVPLVLPGSGAATAIEAEALRTDVAFSVSNQVTEGTMTPSGTAGGMLTIFNSNNQAILLPAGTEFVAVRGDGQEVPFLSTVEVLVPGATTSDTGAQIVTNRGQAFVNVLARSPGSGSNVDGNQVRRITPPGGVSFTVGSGGILVDHPPLTGGTEEEVRIVRDTDVQANLGPALEGLDAEARRQLEALARARNLVLEPSTILPRRSDLEQLQGFEYLVQPAVGQVVDSVNPTFVLNTQAQYSALATANDRPLESQLAVALTEQLRQAGQLTPGDCRAPVVTAWRWDGESLLVDGEIGSDTTSPGCSGELDAVTLDQIRNAIRGKLRQDAALALDQLVARGVIGGYTLPDVERLPRWDWQIQIES